MNAGPVAGEEVSIAHLSFDESVHASAHKTHQSAEGTIEAHSDFDRNLSGPNVYSPCREVRLGTASMAASTGGGSGEGGGPFIDSSRLDLRRYARRPSLAMVLAEYLIFVERNPRKVSVSLPSAEVVNRH